MNARRARGRVKAEPSTPNVPLISLEFASARTPTVEKQWPQAGLDQRETSLVERRASAARPQGGRSLGVATSKEHLAYLPRVDDLRGISTLAPFYKACLALISARLWSLLLYVLVHARLSVDLRQAGAWELCVCVCVCVGVA